MNPYESVFKEIITLSNEYEMSTGLKPTKLYIGREQANRLKQWCYDAGYIYESDVVFGEGLHRPEVAGLAVYLVNAEDHMRCCN